jgi:ABC-type oligopeptide transport system substrate-binding subunit
MLACENWWLFEGLIVGLDEYRRRIDPPRKKSRPDVSFDYDVELEGMQKLADHEFRIVLRKAHPRFRWMLAMPQLSIVPREAVSKYGDTFGTPACRNRTLT